MKRNQVFFGWLFILFSFLPALFLIIIKEQNFWAGVLTIINQVLILILIFSKIIVIQKITKSNLWKIFFSVLFTCYFILVFFIISYWLHTGIFFDIFYFLDSFQDIIVTSMNYFGYTIYLLIAFSVSVFFLFYTIFIKLFHNLNNLNLAHFPFSKTIIFLVVILGIFLIPPANGYLFNQVEFISATQHNRKILIPEFPNNNHYQTNAFENIFILQLESINAMAWHGDFELEGKKYLPAALPNLSKIAQKGVYFPSFWGNTIQTNRAMATILCGVINNIGQAFSYRPEEIQSICLPELLKKSGYQTLYFTNFADLSAFNIGEFVTKLGFAEIHSEDIMSAEDQEYEYEWGYDDCIFYERAFAHLLQNHAHPQKSLIYFAVSSHHAPFSPKEKYAAVHEFETPENFLETYLNSLLEQDHCLADFYQKYQNYAPQNTHLFITGDHSWPVGINDGNTFNEKKCL